MKKHGAKANEKLKAELARARLERLARPKKKRTPEEDAGRKIDRAFDLLK